MPDQTKIVIFLYYILAGTTQFPLSDLDSVQNRLRTLVCDELFSSLQSLPHRRNVANLSLFRRNIQGKCSNSLHSFFPPIHNQNIMCLEHRGESIFISFVFLCYGGSFPQWTSSLELSLYESDFRLDDSIYNKSLVATAFVLHLFIISISFNYIYGFLTI